MPARPGRASRIARWYSPLMSIETARIDSRRSPSSSKKLARLALLRPGAHQTIAPNAIRCASHATTSSKSRV